MSPPHPAATVVLIRPAPIGREVLLLRRPLWAAFAPDSWVFPGGRLDPSDYELDHLRFANGPAPSVWARMMELEDHREAGAYAVAAIREAWEETGVLLAHGDINGFEERGARLDLLAGRSTFSEILETAGLRLSTARLRYIAHWITPDWLPRRFDTRFFLAEAAGAASCTLEGEELVGFRWLSPAAALRAADAGEMNLLPPTADTLRRLEAREY